MTNDTPQPDLAKIHDLLLAAFTPEDLRRFCYNRPTFRPVVNRFGRPYRLDDMADQLIIYCDNYRFLPELLAALKELHPRQYARFIEPGLSEDEPDLPTSLNPIRLTVYVLSFLIFSLTAGWLIVQPNFEPAIAFMVSIVSAVSLLASDNAHDYNALVSWIHSQSPGVVLTIRILTGILIGILATVVVLGLWRLWLGELISPRPTTLCAAIGDTRTRPSDGMVMVCVPGGEFPMGSSDGEVMYALRVCREYRKDCTLEWFERETPRHMVKLDSFWIDRTEVTNGQYQQCVEAGVCEPPAESSLYIHSTYYGNPGYDDYPIIHVPWHHAVAYCAWVGARLPTEAEWEYAARGSTGKLFPWGNPFDGNKLNYCDASCEKTWADDEFDDGYAYTAQVGKYKDGASWCYALNMAGNVYEWVKDRFGTYSSERQENPVGPSSGEERVARGGSWVVSRDGVRGTGRISLSAASSTHDLGFRCVIVVNQ